MTYDEMNSFILNYIKNDITGRAIMLTGEWGSGKSYYVKNTLKPFLEDNEADKHKCVIVSLYGLSDISEISKSIYIELRTIKKVSSSETETTAKAVGKIVCKTILNGLVGKIGFDIGSINDKDLQEIYESVDLTGKLIVLEDIERTQIDIIELLGYINNMCENDGVKVLLVTNESELIHYSIEEIPAQEHSFGKNEYKKVYSEKSLKYLKAKEKSISDTLQFHADFQKTINSIIDNFKNSDLNSFKNAFTAPKHFITRNDIRNYREVIVACQKACDIYNRMDKYSITADSEFKKCVFIGLVNYLQKCLDDHDLKFKDNSILDANLSGDIVYPLMRFCYDYYHSQIISENDIIKTIAEYNNYLIYVDKTGYDDKDLKVLYNFYISTENALNEALQSIYTRLNNVSDISLNHYDRIINYLLLLKYDAKLNNDKIDGIIEKIIDNIKGRGANFTQKPLFSFHTFEIQDINGAKKFDDIKNKFFESLNYTSDFIDIPNSSNYDYIISKISNDNILQYNPNMIMKKIPLDRIFDHIPKFNAETLDDLRYILSIINYNELSEDTLLSIKKFKDDISSLPQKDGINLDCIQKLQLKWICDAIERKI